MAAVKEIYQFLDQIAPFSLQMDFDNAGFLVGRGEAQVRRILVALDITAPVAEEAGRLGCLPVLNCHPWEGISASIRLGLLAAKDADGALFAVCDQPHLTTESILRLLNSFEKSPESIHALSWQGRRGNPVVFPRALYPELLALTGDTGGSAVLRRHPERLRLVEAASPGELEDVDRPEDLAH